jgi:hypothetical protein
MHIPHAPAASSKPTRIVLVAFLFTSLCWLTERRTTEIDDDHGTALLLLLGQLGP